MRTKVANGKGADDWRNDGPRIAIPLWGGGSVRGPGTKSHTKGAAFDINLIKGQGSSPAFISSHRRENTMSVRATPEEVEVIRQGRLAGLTNGEIAKRIGFRPEDVSRNMPEELKKATGKRSPSVRTSTLSMKEHVFKVIQDRGRIGDIKELSVALAHDGFPGTDPHTLQHLVHQLKKDGRITVNVAKSGTKQRLTDLRPIKVNGTARQAQAVPQPVQEPPSAPVVSEETDQPAGPTFPLLEALRARNESKDQELANKLMEAAAILEDVRPVHAAALQKDAEAIAERLRLTPVEAEYLIFAEYTERSKKGD